MSRQGDCHRVSFRRHCDGISGRVVLYEFTYLVSLPMLTLCIFPFGSSSDFVLRRFHQDFGFVGIHASTWRRSKGPLFNGDWGSIRLGPRGPVVVPCHLDSIDVKRAFCSIQGGYAAANAAHPNFVQVCSVLPYYQSEVDRQRSCDVADVNSDSDYEL